MTPRRVRLTVRRLMIAVAIVAVVLGLADRLKRGYLRGAVALHARLERENSEKAELEEKRAAECLQDDEGSREAAFLRSEAKIHHWIAERHAIERKVAEGTLRGYVGGR